MKNKYGSWNIFTFILMLAVNFLATSLPLNNLTTKEISDSFNIFFVPAGYVFSIWGLIYLGLMWKILAPLSIHLKQQYSQLAARFRCQWLRMEIWLSAGALKRPSPPIIELLTALKPQNLCSVWRYFLNSPGGCFIIRSKLNRIMHKGKFNLFNFRFFIFLKVF